MGESVACSRETPQMQSLNGTKEVNDKEQLTHTVFNRLYYL